MSRIIRLQVDNVKKLRAVDITPPSNLVVIGGKNDQGKSSLLDSIGWLLGGTRTLPEEPIRHGEKGARIIADLGDIIVTRTITPSGGNLTVKSKDGATYSSPQAILDKLTGKLSFDPLAFTLMKASDQLNALKKLVGLDFTEEDGQILSLYNERTDVGRQLDSALAIFNSLPHHPNTPAGLIDVAAVVAEYEAAQATNTAAKELGDKADALKGEIFDRKEELTSAEKFIQDIEEQIASLQKRREGALILVKNRKADVAAAEKAAEEAHELAMKAPQVETAPIREKLANAEATNAHVRANAKKEEERLKSDSLQAKVKELTASIDHIEAAKKAKLAAAKFPVPGLSFSDSTVIYDGVPFSQASSAVKIKVSVAMAIALNPTLKVMLIRDGSLLDEESLALIGQMAFEHDAQVWVERVGKGAECAVIIEDGSVLEPVTAGGPEA